MHTRHNKRLRFTPMVLVRQNAATKLRCGWKKYSQITFLLIFFY